MGEPVKTSWKLVLSMVFGTMLLSDCGGGEGGFEFNGLYWQVGPDQNMNWYESKEWVDGLGGNWRMPAMEELQGLWNAGISSDNWGPFENSGYGIWSGDVRDSSSAWVFDFYGGSEYWSTRSSSNYGGRVFAVRSR